MNINKKYDVVIVGSGFGGSVSALRMAEKGYSVLVIEKGKRFNTGDFPKTNWNFRKYFWAPKLFMYGIQCLTLLKDVFILHGAGVGGGSLVYANTHLIPPDKAFEDPNWTDKNWKQRLRPFYEFAQKMLGTVPSHGFGATDELLKECADELGKSDSFKKVNVGVYFGKPGENIKDPYFDGEGPDRKGCIMCGGCMVGCNHESKNTLDKNYLYLAEKLGVDILPEHEVKEITPQNNGYKLVLKKSTGIIPTFKTIESEKLILSGGVMGTVKLLFKCKDKGNFPKLSNRLGDFVRTNSEAILGVVNANPKNQDYSKGIAISAQFHPDEKTSIEAVRFGKGQNALGGLSTVMPISRKLPNILGWGLAIFQNPTSFLRSIFPYKWSENSVILLVMQPINNYLKLNYKSRWWRLGFKSMNSNRSTKDKIPAHIPIGEKVAEMISKKNGGSPVTSYFDSILGIPSTAHILGGCSIGKDVNCGVIDEKFEVFNYPGMYVIDGSSIPSNLGVNPSLTITAMAEYAMSVMPKKGEE